MPYDVGRQLMHDPDRENPSTSFSFGILSAIPATCAGKGNYQEHNNFKGYIIHLDKEFKFLVFGFRREMWCVPLRSRLFLQPFLFPYINFHFTGSVPTVTTNKCGAHTFWGNFILVCVDNCCSNCVHHSLQSIGVSPFSSNTLMISGKWAWVCSFQTRFFSHQQFSQALERSFPTRQKW